MENYRAGGGGRRYPPTGSRAEISEIQRCVGAEERNLDHGFRAPGRASAVVGRAFTQKKAAWLVRVPV